MARQKTLIKYIDTNQKGNLPRYSATYENTPDGFFIRGRTTAGKSWTVKLDPIGFGGSLRECDLDGNGQPDWLLTRGTAACGIAPCQELTVLMFDKRQLPSGHQLVGYFSEKENGTGLEDVRVIPSAHGAARRPFIIHQKLVYAETNHKGKNFWRWQIFRGTNSRLEEWKGLLAGTEFPTFVWYSYKSNHKSSAMSPWLETHSRSQQGQMFEVKVELQD